MTLIYEKEESIAIIGRLLCPTRAHSFSALMAAAFCVPISRDNDWVTLDNQSVRLYTRVIRKLKQLTGMSDVTQDTRQDLTRHSLWQIST